MLHVSPIESSTFSPATKAKVRHWHDRAAALLSSLDVAIGHTPSATEAAVDRVERLLAEARVDLQVLLAALTEIHAEQTHVVVRAPEPAAEAVKALSTAEVATLRSLHASPPQAVREVMLCTTTLLTCDEGGDAARELASWEEAQRCMAGNDLKRRLLSADPRGLAAAPTLTQRVRLRLASLGESGASSRTRRGDQTLVSPPGLQVATRSGGRAVGALYLWCARMLAAADVERVRAHRAAEAAEAEALEDVLRRARHMLDELEREREGLSVTARPRG